MMNYCKSCRFFDTCGDFTRSEECAGYECAPATIAEITNEANAIREQIEAITAHAETLSDNHMTAWREAREAHKAGDKTKAEAEKVTLNGILAALLNNERVVIINNAIPALVEVFQKHDGKSYGEKTKYKIAEEINEKCGSRVYINKEFYTSIYDSLTIYSNSRTIDDHGVRVCTKYNEETKSRQELLTKDNKINGAAFAELVSPEPLTDYIVNPAAYVAELHELKGAAETAKAALVNACGAYNSLCSDRNKWLSTYYNLTK